MFNDDDSNPPLALDLQAVDLTMHYDAEGREVVRMRLIDATGLRIDCPMERAKAEAFGESLRDYAA
jgi:hypothetical protein